ncbi:HD domain-containing phosphohydrolase [Devosia sp. YR412]|uniref:HD domain-containing phosphohydrolase n=1 Tax=Devosia sp. YR412 TaxID=1881030 RepID=UPI00147C598D|nr:HD domain-containing phosphohydrolase [Devosia sp. YR412]
MIVEDNSTLLALMLKFLGKMEGVDVEGLIDPVEALQSVSQQTDLILVDYMMPGMHGIAFIKAIRANPLLSSIPIIMITVDCDQAVRLEAIEAGATDFLTKPVSPVELRARAGNLLALRQAQNSLIERARSLELDIAAATSNLLEREEEVLGRLARAIEYRDSDTGDHVGRVGAIARIIGEELGLDPVALRNLRLAAPLHDVGKIGVPDAILNKPGRLDDEEMALVRRHVDVGAAILKDSKTDMVQMACEIAANHHEKWDGTGYPRGLRGVAIPLSARITAIADVFDALCSDRPYKRAWSPQDAYDEIIRGAGGHFDPLCVSAFARGQERILDVMQHRDVDLAA